VWIVVAAYNEQGVVGSVVRGLRQQYPNVVVVDDGSSDGTGRRALEAGAVVLRHPVNLGQGAALQTGVTFALDQGAERVATFDADGQHDVGDLRRMLDLLDAKGADVVLGSRFLGQAVGMTRVRRTVLRLAVLFTTLTTGVRLTDAHNGLRVFTRAAARCLAIRRNRMGHASEIIETIARHRLRFVEAPVTIYYTEYSKAKGQKLSNAVNIVGEIVMEKVRK
jgi:glycosyltransferase involved in cell wall biosynthesis